MKLPKTHTFNGVKYDIDISDPLDGYCDSPRGGKPTLRIVSNLNTKTGLITVLHEALHAEGWAVSEDVVDRVSSEIGNLLWRLNYRRQVK